MGKDSSELLWDDINRPKFYTLLTFASATIRTGLYPAALVKTRLQASGSGGAPAQSAIVPVYRSTGDAFRTILRTEGKFALYRGFRMNLLGLAVDPIVIGCIEFSRTRLTYYSNTFTPYTEGHYQSPFFRYVMSPTTAITMISAGGSACVGQIIQVPVDIISQKKQMQMHPLQTPDGRIAPKVPGTTSMAIARHIIQTEGIKGMYKGFGVTLCSATPFTAILWAVYWPTQRFLHDGLAHHPAAPPSASPPFSASLPPISAGLPTERSAHPPVRLRPCDLPPGAKLPPDEEVYLIEEKHHLTERLLAHQQGRSVHYEHQPTPSNGWGFNWRESVPTPIAAFIASATASLATQPIGQNPKETQTTRRRNSHLVDRFPPIFTDCARPCEFSFNCSDVIKTRLQVGGGSNTTIMSTIRTLIKERGYRGLGSGWYPRILAVSPGTTIMMSSYEVLKRFCQK